VITAARCTEHPMTLGCEAALPSCRRQAVELEPPKVGFFTSHDAPISMEGVGVGIVVTPCPICGAWLRPDDCVDVTTLGDPETRYIPVRCPTPKCGKVCRTCRRDVGDVHGPHCWEHMRFKVESPHLVDWSDCR
jgi:hypothetical protein